MNKNTLLKFSLTLVCSAVLAACSSGGGSDNSAAQKADTTTAGTTTAGTTTTDTTTTDTTTAGTTTTEDSSTSDSKSTEQTDAEKVGQQTVNENTVGHKFVKKTESNFNVGEGAETNSKSSTSITAMTVNLEPSLDTIVVAIPLKSDGTIDKNGKQAYLEDFDFRATSDAVNTAYTSGEHTLEHIYHTDSGATTSGTSRGTDKELLTKTGTEGTDTGLAYVYQDGRLNYTHKQEGKDVLDTKDARTEARLSNSVAEVYGHRTFVEGDSVLGTDSGEASLANAPFGAKDTDGEYVNGVQLQRVQYGRVTSKLNEVDPSSLKDGKTLGIYKTQVASYANHGSTGSEDHYFYRGVDDTTSIAGLNNYYNLIDGKLVYQGHAVTYNLDRDFDGNGSVPNAIGYKQALVSGTHVYADIDLASKDVTGKLYDVWRYGAVNSLDKGAAGVTQTNFNLATFNGKLSDNGGISGTATKTADNTAGVLKADLFGDKGQELGGTIASNDTSNNWGASFGAKIQNEKYVPPVVVEPTPEVAKPAWGESTDQTNKNNPLNK